MPKDDTEIILPEQVLHSGNLSVTVGDTLTLELGERYYQGEKLGGQEYNAILDETDHVCEELKHTRKKTYTGVGIYERAVFEYPNAPGYPAFTAGDDQGMLTDVYLKAEDMKDCVQITRYLAGGWDAVIDLMNADVNGDGTVNLKDAALLRRYLAGGWDVELQ